MDDFADNLTPHESYIQALKDAEEQAIIDEIQQLRREAHETRHALRIEPKNAPLRYVFEVEEAKERGLL